MTKCVYYLNLRFVREHVGASEAFKTVAYTRTFKCRNTRRIKGRDNESLQLETYASWQGRIYCKHMLS